jgi:hypothetical protein
MGDKNGRDDAPNSWQVAESLNANIRDVTRRAETDSLFFVAIIVGFLIVRDSAASSLSIIGLQITNLRIVQFVLPPLAAFVSLRYAKAESLSASIGMQLRRLLDADLPSVPIAVSPPDWDIVRDVAVRLRSVSNFFPIGTSMVMFALVAAGTVVNFFDARGSSIPWVVISSLITTLIILIMLPSKPAWPDAVIARTPRD